MSAAFHPLTPIPHPLAATVQVPGSKSLTNRALLLAALAEGVTTLTNTLESDDARYFREALRALGFTVTEDGGQKAESRKQKAEGSPQSPISSLQIHGLGGVIPAQHAELFIGNAGTAARFLTAMLPLGHGVYVLDGNARMRQRPIGDLVAALRQLGVVVEESATESGGRHQASPVSSLQLPIAHLPLRIRAAGLPGGTATVSGEISSQFLSGLLMAAPYARGPIELVVTGELNSQPYVAMTLAIMREFGVEVTQHDFRRFTITPQKYVAPATYAIESDASAASYFFAAPAICGGTVRVQNLTRTAKQGDVAFVDVLAQMGCTVEESAAGLAVTGPRPGELRGVTVDMRHIPDTAQTLAAIAPFANGPTVIRGIASARLKETDRVAAMCAELRRLGVVVEEYPDGLRIEPGAQLRPATIETYDDHRMAMAFALPGLRCPGVVIANPGCVAKTFPNYFAVLETLR